MTLSGSQSNFRQQFVRIGGALDLGSGAPIGGGGSGSSDGGGGDGGGGGVTPGNYWAFNNLNGGTFRLYHDRYEPRTSNTFYGPGDWYFRIVGQATGFLFVDYFIDFRDRFGNPDPPFNIEVPLEGAGEKSVYLRDLTSANKGFWRYRNATSTTPEIALPGSKTRYDNGSQSLPARFDPPAM